MSCPAAANRLLQIGVPATIEHSESVEKSGSEKYVAEAVQVIFIYLFILFYEIFET